ncbi:MAG TPA: winged helix-turn-helix domain-containing protein, partial [Candidatus Paceibacterota bacterium]|nr:winged helix-turn-helix domain-containing protein [Candidatus Paceibacterota bacterium]
GCKKFKISLPELAEWNALHDMYGVAGLRHLFRGDEILPVLEQEPAVPEGSLPECFKRRDLHFDSKQLSVRGSVGTMYFTPQEWAVLDYLLLAKGSPRSKRMIFEHLYGRANSTIGTLRPSLKIVDVLVCKLRKKLERAGKEEYIDTTWGRGYSFKV